MYNLSYGKNEDTQILEEMKKLWKIMQWTPESVQSIEKINNLKVEKRSNIKIKNIKAKDYKENT